MILADNLLGGKPVQWWEQLIYKFLPAYRVSGLTNGGYLGSVTHDP